MAQKGKPFPEYVTSRTAVAAAPGSIFPQIVGEDGRQLTYAQLVALIVANSGLSGAGLPSGGTTGQPLVKGSNADYDADWQDYVGLSLEEVRDDLASVLQPGDNIEIVIDDVGNTITVSSTASIGGHTFHQNESAGAPTATAFKQTWYANDTGNAYTWFDDGVDGAWVQYNGGGGSSETDSVVYVVDATYGDDSTDATVYIQGLLDQAATTHGTVLVPDGIFQASDLSLDSRVTLKGVGLRSVIKKKASTAGPLLSLANDLVQGVTVADLWLDGNKANQTDDAAHGIHFDNRDTSLSPGVTGLTADAHHLIRDVYVSNCEGSGVVVAGRGDTHLVRVKSYGNDFHGFNIEGFDIWVIDCIAGSNGGHGYLNVAGNNTFTGCKAFLSGDDDFHIGPQSYWGRYTGCVSQGAYGNGFYLDTGCRGNLLDVTVLDADYAAAGLTSAIVVNGGLNNQITAAVGDSEGVGAAVYGVYFETESPGTRVNVVGNRSHFTGGLVGGDINEAIINPPATKPALYLPGVTGNWVQAPDAAAFDVAGDLEVVFRLALVDYTPAASMCIFARRTVGDGLHSQLTFSTAGLLFFSFRTGGVDYFNNSQLTNPGYVNGTPYWWRFRRVSSTGAITGDYAPGDTPVEPTIWTALTPSGTQTAGAIEAKASPLEIGSNRGGSNDMLHADVYRLIVRAGINGTTIADYDSAIPSDRYVDAFDNVWAVAGTDNGWRVA